jgi:hypothetical protein
MRYDESDVRTQRPAHELLDEGEFDDSGMSLALVYRVVAALDGLDDVGEATRAVLDAVRDVCGWTYGAYHRVGAEPGELSLVAESGRSDPQMRRMKREVADLVEVRGGVRVPVTAGGRVIGAMEFLDSTRKCQCARMGGCVLAPGSVDEERNEALIIIGAVVGQAIRRIEAVEAGREIAVHARALAEAASAAAERVGGARDAVADLGQSGSEIGSVVRVITSIAAQTHLLALDAAIEAARVGEAGAQLATVAGEVQQLAQQAGDATGEVEQRIGEIQAGTAGALAGIGALSTAVDGIDRLSRRICEVVAQRYAPMGGE